MVSLWIFTSAFYLSFSKVYEFLYADLVQFYSPSWTYVFVSFGEFSAIVLQIVLLLTLFLLPPWDSDGIFRIFYCYTLGPNAVFFLFKPVVFL